MDRIQAKQMGKDIEEALGVIAEKYSMDLEYRGGTFSDTDYKPRATFTGKSTSGKTRAEAEWDLYHSMLGLKKEWLGEIISYQDSDQIIVGLDMKKFKYPVLLEDGNGKKYKASAENIKFRLGSRR